MVLANPFLPTRGRIDGDSLHASPYRRGLHYGMMEAAVAAGMYAAMENWVVPLLQARFDAPRHLIGMLSWLPQVCALVLGPYAGVIIRRFGGYKRVAVSTCGIQATCLVLLLVPLLAPIGIAQPGGWTLPVGMTLAMGVNIIGIINGAAWTSWMGDLVPGAVRGRFVSQRARLFIAVKLAFAVLFAAIIEYLPIASTPWGLALVMLIAASCRYGSMWCLMRQPTPQRRPAGERPDGQLLTTENAPEGLVGDLIQPWIGLPVFLRTMFRTEFGRWTAVWASLHFGVMIAGPYFQPYMITDAEDGGLGLKHEPLLYLLLMQTSMVVRFLAYPLAGRLVELHGPQAMLRVGVIGIALIPFAWALTSNLSLLLVAEVVSGISWCLAECAVVTLIFAVHPDPHRRAQLIGYHQAVVAMAIILGSAGGGLLLWLDTHVGLPRLWGSFYPVLFLISIGLRLPAVWMASRMLPAMRDLEDHEREDLIRRIPGLPATLALGRGLLGFFKRPEG